MSGDSRLQGNSKTRLGDLKDNLGTAYFLKTARLREIRMQDLTEKTIRKVGTVRITNLRVIFGTKSYAISNLEDYGLWFQIGLYLGIAALFFFIISRKTKYKVQIRNPVSELTVLET